MRRLTSVIGCAAALLLALMPAARTAHAADDPICFPEAPAVSACVDAQFAPFWRAGGGLATFGYPLAAAQQELSPETGRSYLTQYFERQRFEYHPELAPPYDVQLGRVGDAYLRHTGRDWHQMPMGDPGARDYMPATGHAIAPAFAAYYHSHGVELGDPGLSARECLALFGYPISEAFVEDVGGQPLLVQYFERARMEYHPANPDAYRVQQGLLSSDLHDPDVAHHNHHVTGAPDDEHHPSEPPAEGRHDSHGHHP